MTTALFQYPPARVPVEHLRLTEERLVAGGHSKAISVCRYAAGWYVLKEYRDDARHDVSLGALERMVHWGRSLPADAHAELLRRCAWPVASVWRGTDVAGILMLRAPNAMFEAPRRGSHSSHGPRHLDVLRRSPTTADKLGVRYWEPPRRLAALGRYLDTILWLHERGYVVGDVQLRNALVSEAGRVLLLDCDSFVPANGTAPLPALAPEQWQSLSNPQERPSRASDLRKFALAVIRCTQENLETRTADRDHLATLLTSPTIAMIADAAEERAVDPAARRWRALTEDWPALVTPDRMFVRTDEGRRRWPGSVPRPTVTSPQSVPTEPAKGPDPAQRARAEPNTSTSQPEPWTVWNTVVVVIVLAVTVGVVGSVAYGLYRLVAWIVGLFS